MNQNPGDSGRGTELGGEAGERVTVVTYLSLAAAVVFWGGSFAATKVVLTEFSVYSYMFIRFAAAGLLFLGIVLRHGVPPIDRKDHMRLLLVAFFEPGLYFFFETEGLNRTGAADAALIIASAPVVVGVLSRVFLGERQSARTIIGAALSILGVAVIVYGSRGSAQSSVTGNLLVVGAVVAASLYMITARSLAGRVSTLYITAFQVFYGALFFLFPFLLTAGTADWAAVSYRSLTALVFLVFGATLIAFLGYNRALRDVSAAKASVWLNGIPVVAAVAAWLVLGETLGLRHLIGGGLVLTGVLSSSRRRRRSSATPSAVPPGG